MINFEMTYNESVAADVKHYSLTRWILDTIPPLHYAPDHSAPSKNNNTDKMPPCHHLTQRCASMKCMFQSFTENYFA